MDQESILRAAAQAAKSMPAQQPSMVYPQPVPMSVQLTSGQGMGGEKYVILILQTPIGQNIFHFDPEGAEKLAEGLIETARLSRTGLEIARA